MKQTKAAKGLTITPWSEFQSAIKAKTDEINALLPRHISRERFMSSALAAAKQNPNLLGADKRSVMNAVTRSAQDGLLPDGREGVITVYREKQKDNSWLNVASWNPMTAGLRKRAREIDGIAVNAQVVYANDHFLRIEGDDPRIEHHPAPLGQDRGDMIGAYAVFRSREGEILHREIMTAGEINAVRAQSRQQEGLLWGTFTGEAWRKTVIRRGFKSVPVSEPLQTIVTRDDDEYDFAEPSLAEIRTVAGREREQPRVVSGGARKSLPPIVGAADDGHDEACEPATDEGASADTPKPPSALQVAGKTDDTGLHADGLVSDQRESIPDDVPIAPVDNEARDKLIGELLGTKSKRAANSIISKHKPNLDHPETPEANREKVRSVYLGCLKFFKEREAEMKSAEMDQEYQAITDAG